MPLPTRIFTEPVPEHVSHSAASRVLAEDQTMVDCLAACIQEIIPSTQKQVEALKKWPQADEPSETGYMIANNVNESKFYVRIAEDLERAERFAGMMSL